MIFSFSALLNLMDNRVHKTTQHKYLQKLGQKVHVGLQSSVVITRKSGFNI